AGAACLGAQGVPDVVIANAGISIGVDTAERADLDVLARTFATNNVGLAATFHPFVRPMAQRGSGRLVGIASVAGIRGLPGHGGYCASKAAVISYCE
ncbi:SDR family NAD(P)-dependent oxidoreductase, partial [Klebsiella pneumoniae]|uniref:SDR family NAD(P)-dependent oxidoreductase n=1 Tax=Klebsiella pneumoniae TaxID=573 RepID=UPI00210BBC6D